MLDVQRGPYVDAGREQLLDVLPALGVPAAGSVGVGVFVDEQQARVTRQRRIEVELVHDQIAVDDRLARQDLEALEQRLRLDAAVGLDETDHHVPPFGFRAASRREHGVGLAHAGRRPEKYLELPASLFLGEGKEGLRRCSLRCFGGHSKSPPRNFTTEIRLVRAMEIGNGSSAVPTGSEVMQISGLDQSRHFERGVTLTASPERCEIQNRRTAKIRQQFCRHPPRASRHG